VVHLTLTICLALTLLKTKLISTLLVLALIWLAVSHLFKDSKAASHNKLHSCKWLTLHHRCHSNSSSHSNLPWWTWCSSQCNSNLLTMDSSHRWCSNNNLSNNKICLVIWIWLSLSSSKWICMDSNSSNKTKPQVSTLWNDKFSFVQFELIIDTNFF